MEYFVRTRWVDGLAFDSVVGNHTVRLDASGDLGTDTGPSPKKLLLASLAACTGMDVVSLLQKMRVAFDRLEINVQTTLTEDHPKVFQDIEMIYRLSGNDINREKVEKAVQLSRDKYCGVSAMLEKHSPIRHTIVYE